MRSAKKLESICALYRSKVGRLLQEASWEDNQQLYKARDLLAQILTFEDWDKANRWLGFVQGILWCNGIYTIDEMRDHTRMTKDDFPGHSLHGERACSACGDIDGCHMARLFDPPTKKESLQ